PDLLLHERIVVRMEVAALDDGELAIDLGFGEGGRLRFGRAGRGRLGGRRRRTLGRPFGGLWRGGRRSRRRRWLRVRLGDGCRWRRRATGDGQRHRRQRAQPESENSPPRELTCWY